MVGGKNIYKNKSKAMEVSESLYKNILEALIYLQQNKQNRILSKDMTIEIEVEQSIITIVIYFYRAQIIYSISESTLYRALNLLVEKMKIDEKFKNYSIYNYKEKDKYTIIIRK